VATDAGNGAAAEIPLEVEKMLLEILEGFSLGDVIGEFVQVAQPVSAVLPVGEAVGHEFNLRRKSWTDKGWVC